MPKLKYDLTNQIFGLLTALHHVSGGYWLVRCSCGTEKVVSGQNLRLGRLKSCGCAYTGPRAGFNVGSGSSHPRWKGDSISYAAAHQRIATARGPATEHACEVCGNEAQSWSYRGGSTKELVQERPESLIKKVVKYSPDPDDYDPLCWSCHVRRDLANRQ